LFQDFNFNVKGGRREATQKVATLLASKSDPQARGFVMGVQARNRKGRVSKPNLGRKKDKRASVRSLQTTIRIVLQDLIYPIAELQENL